MIWQQVINGISIGGVYALIAVGYSLVYSVLNFSNFAHGEVLMVGAYAGFYAMTFLKVPFSVALGMSVVIGGLVAVLLEKVGYRPLRLRRAPLLYFMISAMGLSIFMQNFTIVTIGPQLPHLPGHLPHPAAHARTAGDRLPGHDDLRDHHRLPGIAHLVHLRAPGWARPSRLPPTTCGWPA